MFYCQLTGHLETCQKKTKNCVLPGTLEEQLSPKSVHELAACKPDNE
jgi:hypothetical protein